MFVANLNKEDAVPAFKRGCKAYGQGKLKVKVFYQRLATYFGSVMMLEHILPHLVRLIPDQRLRRRYSNTISSIPRGSIPRRYLEICLLLHYNLIKPLPTIIVNANYSYSHSRGLYAGVSLEGAVVTCRGEMNSNFYGEQWTPEEILNGTVQHPRAAQCLYDAIDQAMQGVAQFEADTSSASVLRCRTCACQQFLSVKRFQRNAKHVVMNIKQFILRIKSTRLRQQIQYIRFDHWEIRSVCSV